MPAGASDAQYLGTLNLHLVGVRHESWLIDGAGVVTELSELSGTDRLPSSSVYFPPNALPGSALVNDSVGQTQISSGGVSSNELATGAVTGVKIANSAVSSAKLGTNSVQTAKLASGCLLYTSPSPRDRQKSRMPSSA